MGFFQPTVYFTYLFIGSQQNSPALPLSAVVQYVGETFACSILIVFIKPQYFPKNRYSRWQVVVDKLKELGAVLPHSESLFGRR